MPTKSFNDDKNNEVKKIRHVQNKTQPNPTQPNPLTTLCGRRLCLRPIQAVRPLSVTWTAPLQLRYAALY